MCAGTSSKLVTFVNVCSAPVYVSYEVSNDPPAQRFLHLFVSAAGLRPKYSNMHYTSDLGPDQ